MSWLRRDLFPVICGCCGKLVISCWERGHDKSCDDCREHFWLCGPRGDKPCDGKSLAAGLSGKHGSAYEKAIELHLQHSHECRMQRTPMGQLPPKGPERDALCDCGYIAAKRQRETAGVV